MTKKGTQPMSPAPNGWTGDGSGNLINTGGGSIRPASATGTVVIENPYPAPQPGQGRFFALRSANWGKDVIVVDDYDATIYITGPELVWRSIVAGDDTEICRFSPSGSALDTPIMRIGGPAGGRLYLGGDGQGVLLSVRSTDGAPTITDLDPGRAALVDTGTEIRLYANRGGNIVSVALA